MRFDSRSDPHRTTATELDHAARFPRCIFSQLEWSRSTHAGSPIVQEDDSVRPNSFRRTMNGTQMCSAYENNSNRYSYAARLVFSPALAQTDLLRRAGASGSGGLGRRFLDLFSKRSSVSRQIDRALLSFSAHLRLRSQDPYRYSG